MANQVVLWRKKPDSPRAEELQAKLIRLGEQYHHLELLCNAHEPFSPPFQSWPDHPFGYAASEKLAHQFRQLMGLGDRPGQTLLRVMEEVCKIKVFHLDFAPPDSAACAFSEAFGAAILLNAKNVRWRRNFDAAQGLFHLLTWKTFRSTNEAGSVEATEAEKKLAARFACNLLVPPEILRFAVDEALDKHGGKLKFDELFDVARQFDVAAEVVVQQVGFVYQKTADWANVVLNQLQSQISFWDSMVADNPSMLPMRFRSLAHKALRHGLLSTGKYAEYVGATRRDAMRVLEQDDNCSADVEVTSALTASGLTPI